MPDIKLLFNSSDDAHMFFYHSGKTIPNGTDTNQLGTPESEGKFQKRSPFTVVTWL